MTKILFILGTGSYFKTLSDVIQDALRLVRKERLKTDFYQMQEYWSRKAKEKGILTEQDLQRYLKK